jgi:glycosyltransferase involved in cell wall biosynthesis
MICFAILAHEDENVLRDQITNVRTYNPNSHVVVYNGGTNPEFAKSIDVDICPYSRPLSKGRLGPFLFDVMVWLEEIDLHYDYLVCLDSDVMFVREGYETLLEYALNGYDCMGINMGVQFSREQVPHWYPGQTMWAEWQNWQPFFGTDFFAGCLNCMQVYRKRIVHDMIQKVDREALERLFSSTKVFALEEILSPTLAVRAGARYRAYPHEVAKYIRIGDDYTKDEVSDSLRDPWAIFVHPVKRSLQNPARTWIRERSSHGRDTPSSLTIIWASFQGGVETAVANRLRELNTFNSQSHHTYFYYGGTGISLFEDIPHHISKHSDDLVQYIRRNTFQVITFVNTLHNLDQVAESGFNGICLFEFHGFAQPILEVLNRINRREDHGQIKGIVVPGHYVASIAKSAVWKRSDIEIFVARNTVDTHSFRNHSVSKDMLYQLGVPDDWSHRLLLGWVGRLENNKNWRSLLQIFTVLRKRNHEMGLLVAGDTLNSNELNEFIRQVQVQNLTDHVRFLPNLPHSLMPFYYSLLGNTGGALLSTSLAEGYPYHLLEAQACECPVVCTNAGGAVEAVTHGNTGLTYIHDIEDAVKLVEKVIKDQAMRNRLVREAREKVCAVNRMDANVKQYAAWLTQLTASSGEKSAYR